MKRKTALGIVLAVLIIAGYYMLADIPEPLSDELRGSYSCDDTICFRTMAIDPDDDNSFYYTDSKNNCRIKGVFEENGENVYSISCGSEANKAIIPDQSIVLGDRSFTLTVSGQQLTFKKVHQAPILYGDDNNYR
ncbi:MAG: hypothetical protein U0N50_01135 [Christensenellales bacterium]